MFYVVTLLASSRTFLSHLTEDLLPQLFAVLIWLTFLQHCTLICLFGLLQCMICPQHHKSICIWCHSHKSNNFVRVFGRQQYSATAGCEVMQCGQVTYAVHSVLSLTTCVPGTGLAARLYGCCLFSEPTTGMQHIVHSQKADLEVLAHHVGTHTSQHCLCVLTRCTKYTLRISLGSYHAQAWGSNYGPRVHRSMMKQHLPWWRGRSKSDKLLQRRASKNVISGNGLSAVASLDLD